MATSLNFITQKLATTLNPFFFNCKTKGQEIAIWRKGGGGGGTKIQFHLIELHSLHLSLHQSQQGDEPVIRLKEKADLVGLGRNRNRTNREEPGTG